MVNYWRELGAFLLFVYPVGVVAIAGLASIGSRQPFYVIFVYCAAGPLAAALGFTVALMVVVGLVQRFAANAREAMWPIALGSVVGLLVGVPLVVELAFAGLRSLGI